MDDNQVTGPPSLVDYLSLLNRRRWFVILPMLLVPICAALISLMQTPTFQASAEVLLSQKNLTSGLTGAQTPYVDPARVAETEAMLARLPEVARRAVKAAQVPRLNAVELLKASSVSTTPGSDLLTFTVKQSSPELAKRLSTTYARTYTSYRSNLDTQEIADAKAAVSARLATLEAQGGRGSPLYRSLSQKLSQLTALDAFQSPTAVVVQQANEAPKIGPHTARNVFLALVLGAMLGVAVAFLRESLDSRVRSVSAVRSRLGLPVLGTLPPPPRELQESGLVMLAAPTSPDAEPFRFLRASLDVNNSALHAKTIMVTSAMDGEGKTTTAANLAVALARAGRHVILADFDFRRSRIQQVFGLNNVGLSEIEQGDATLEDALGRVSVAPENVAGRNTSPRTAATGTLEVLGVGRASPDPDSLGPHFTAGILESLRERADIVLIDAAPLLPVSDAIALTNLVDAVMLVVRIDTLRSSVLDAVARVISSTPSPAIGFVVTGADWNESFGLYRYPASRDASEDAASPTGPPVAVAEPRAAAAQSQRHIAPVPTTDGVPPRRTLGSEVEAIQRKRPTTNVLHEAIEP